MLELKFCSRCEKVNEECTQKQIRRCLRNSACEYCGGTSFHHPYGVAESTHCRTCGAEWSVWK